MSVDWELLGPALYVLFAWWFGTGAILYLDGLPRRTFGWTMLATTVLAAIAVVGLVVSASDTRLTGAYLAFTCALMLWAWQEVAFLLGYVTGPRQQPCPPQARGWRRTWLATQAVLYHELALLVLGAAVLAATWGGENLTGLWTWAILWAMRQSAKLNVFLGVRNLAEDLLPPHLAYLESYFRRRPMNALFPLSALASLVATVWVWQAALAAPPGFETVSLALAATLLSLGLLEHAFLVLPLPSQALWQWCLRSRTQGGLADATPRESLASQNRHGVRPTPVAKGRLVTDPNHGATP